jgi:Spy/CpxP family protein refolding chaperone
MMLCGLLVTLLAAAPVRAFAEEEEDPFDGRLLSLELIMAHRNEIGLTKAQNREIGELVVAVQQAVAGKSWDMQSAYFELMEVLDEPQIDEDKAIALAKQAVDTENEIKLEQMRLLIRLRNLLTPEQVAVLQTKRAEMTAGG